MMNLNLDPLTFFNEGDSGEQSLLQAAGLWHTQGVERTVSLDDIQDALTTSELCHHDMGISFDDDLTKQTECIMQENYNIHGKDSQNYVETFKSNELDEILDRVADSGLLALNSGGEAGEVRSQNKTDASDARPFIPQALQSAKPDECSSLSSGTMKSSTYNLLPTLSMECGDSFLRRKTLQEGTTTTPSSRTCGAGKPRKPVINKKCKKGTFGIAKPKRPLSAFNYFFSYERAKLLGAPMKDTVGQQGRKRRHRKTHGKIAFTDLAKLISQKWKKIDPESFAFYEAKAAEDLVRYRTAMKVYKEKVAAMETADPALNGNGNENEAKSKWKNASKSPTQQGRSPLKKTSGSQKSKAKPSPVENPACGESSIYLATALKEALDEKKRIRATETTKPTDMVCGDDFTAPSRDVPVDDDKLNDELKRFLDEDVLSILKNIEAVNPVHSTTKPLVTKHFAVCRTPKEKSQLTTPSHDCSIEPSPSSWKHESY